METKTIDKAKKEQLASKGYKLTEVGLIPEDWQVKAIKYLATIIDGDRGAHYPHANELFNHGFCLFLNAGNVTKNGFNFEECTFITKEKDRLLKKGKLKYSDIILTTRGSVGNVAYFDSSIPFKNIRINSGMVIVRNESSEVKTNYLYHLLRSPLFFLQIDRLSFGSAQQQLTVQGINNLQVTLPSLKEQSSIANALSDVDNLIESLDKLIAKKRTIKQATMQQLLTGKKRLPGFSGEWQTKRLEDVASFHKGSGLSKSELFPDGKYLCIHYGELFTTYGEKIKEILSRTNTEGIVLSHINDVLMPTSDVTPNGLATASCINIPDVVIGGDTLIIRSNKNVLNGEFLAYSIKIHRNQIMKLVSGTTVYHLYASELKNFEFKLPPIEEQNSIAEVLSDIDNEIEALEKRREKTKQIKQGMMQELLTGKTRLVNDKEKEKVYG